MVIDTAYPHLHSSARAVIEDSAEDRIRRIRTDRWITYARAEAALASFEDLLTFPKRTRMPNLLLVGATNNGKTMIVERFRRRHPPTPASATEDGIANIPVLKIQMPPGPDERRFFGAILDALGVPHSPSGSVVKRQETAIKMMRATEVSLLIIDDLQNLLSGSRLQQRRLLNVLRWLGNEIQIPLVAAGTVDALHAIQSDDQLANRFEPFGLPPWRDGEEYRQLLSTLEAVLPLQRPSDLSDSALAEKILAAADGILGEVITLVTRAAVMAVTRGIEAITATVVDDCGFVPAYREDSPENRTFVLLTHALNRAESKLLVPLVLAAAAVIACSVPGFRLKCEPGIHRSA